MSFPLLPNWASLGLGLCVIHVVYQHFLSPLSVYPGPFLASFSNLWKFWQQYNHRMPWVLADLHKLHGPVVRTGPNELSFSTAEANIAIYDNDWAKGHMYDSFDILPDVKSTIATKTYAQALPKRRIFLSGFAPSYLDSLEHIIDERFALLRQQLDRFAENAEVFDLRKFIDLFMADAMSKLSFGRPFGAQEAEDPGLVPPARDVLAFAFRIGQFPWLTWIFGKILRASPNPEAGGVSPNHQTMNRMVVESIAKRSSKPTTEQPHDLLSKMQSTKERLTGSVYTPREMFSVSTELVLAGTDTTASVTNILLSNLGRNTTVMEELLEELDVQLPALPPDGVAYSSAGLEKKLPVLNEAIRESHRHNTISTFNMPKQVPPQGAVISGFDVPGGTQVFVNNYVLHRNPAIWGSDADVYDPRRFSDKRGEGKKHVVSPFLPGRRTCVGQTLAVRLILKTVATLLKVYEFEFVNRDEPVVVVPVASGHLVTPLSVRCRRRAGSIEKKQ